MIRTACVLLAAFCSAIAWGENWPQFRGPRGDGTSSERNVPTRWSVTENVVWKSTIPGEGHSSPVVWNESVFLTSAIQGNGDRVLVRLDAISGKAVWQVKVGNANRESMH